MKHQGRIILDGHFTLSKPDGKIEAVAIDVFQSLKLEGVVVYHDDPSAIAARLNQRDGGYRTTEDLALHQDREITHANLVASQLNVPLKLLTAFDTTGLVAVITSWTANK